ncbi:hypothetical protein DY000_02014347 [Brassica cretica]|uniref:Uncharacterized protein n=1 Tax=Brassica cretica TaxID=69181 RepID=A0ABQ7D2H9_BRACR|nr:hypothetical protein DY000_02014347 [Brassica cretica]
MLPVACAATHSAHMSLSLTEFKRAPDGGAGEVVFYEAYLEAGFRGVIPSLIGEVSSFFGFCLSQLTPLTWRTLMAIQVLGKLHGFSVGVHEILYFYYFAPLMNKAGRYVFVKIQEPVGYPASWRTVDKCVPPGFLCWRSSSEAYNGSSSTIPMGELSGNVARLPVSVVFDEYQKAKARKQRPSYTPPPRLARAALSANGPSSTSSTSVEVGPDRDPLVDAHRRLIGEVFLLRGQLQDMVARRDLLVQQDVLPPVLRSKWNFVVYDASLFVGYVRTRGSSGDPEVSRSPEVIFESCDCIRDPEVSLDHPEIVSGPRGLYLDPEVAWEPGGTILRLPRQGYYRYLFGFRILPLGNWPLLRSYVVFYFCRKSLTSFRGCWCGCYDPSARTRGSSGDPEVSRSPEVIFESCDCIRDPEEPGDSLIDLEIMVGTRRPLSPYKNPEVSSLDTEIFDWNPKGPYSAFLGKATAGTYLDFAFCRSEAGRYRDPMLYSTSAGSH